MFFVGLLVGFVVGAGLALFLRLPLADWPTFIRAAATGFGLGLGLVAVAWVVSLAVRLLDRQSQRLRGGAGEP